jgi:hypothetical protein
VEILKKSILILTKIPHKRKASNTELKQMQIKFKFVQIIMRFEFKNGNNKVSGTKTK